ncbi:MAG: high-potential iron-sulfur protein [Thiohalocapsa sp.]|jgi:hypothetical protein|nr:high-potential iron-sulfur protein [Thiohalocapsa sp.]MCF7992908.1 high-potential iron-sulfur protein [Thiohalocapsa sp.]
MSVCNRRQFIVRVGVGASALALARLGVAEEAKPALTEDDAYAKSMGFKLDASQVDRAKFTKFEEGQSCSTCQLYSGAEGDPLGPCSFFGGRLVPPTGWCRNFKPKNA